MTPRTGWKELLSELAVRPGGEDEPPQMRTAAGARPTPPAPFARLALSSADAETRRPQHPLT